ncbi:U3 snoRNP protein [Paramarasmius palmivorus]|uniref:U3 snoRNP protein n=1 Tax=Paramarasmius palmivorus TaxID=297713 RepID=A0AAW0C8V3_9AGAR
MERVQFQQEQMLDELKDLVEKKLFTVKETKQIIKQRTAFENALIRRVAKKADFLRYAQYEMNLELLRRKRLERAKVPPGPATVSDYALVRRQFHIFERALKRFKSDVGLWTQYIQVAQKEGARSLVGRITARALQLHPNVPSLYIIAAQHELSHLSPSTARSLLQRGIRMNPESIEIWREYVKMELGFIESLRRRWDVLGIKNGKGKEKERLLDINDGSDAEDITMLEEGPSLDEGIAARQEILDGVIVKTVISSAVQALPKIELFESLNGLINEYPSPTELRESLLTHLDGLLRATMPEHPQAIRILSTRLLRPGLVGERLIEGVKGANTMMLSSAKNSGKEETLQVYSYFVMDQCHSLIDDDLKLYLVSSLKALIHTHRTSPSLLSTHIKLLTEGARQGVTEQEKVLITAQRYTSRVPGSACVWLARLAAIQEFSGTNIEEVWAEARRCVSGSYKDVAAVWTWGLGFLGDERKRNVHEELLRESMRDSSLRDVHELLLMSYVSVLSESRQVPETGRTADTNQETNHLANWLIGMRHMQRTFLTTGKVWQKAFTLEMQGAGDTAVLREIYEFWRRVDLVESTVEWAKWLLKTGNGKEAKDVVSRSNNEEVRERWRMLVEKGEAEAGGEI